MRSLMIGDCNHYVSPYMIGVREAMARLGHEHSECSIRNPIDILRMWIDKVQPDILWTHMILWAPKQGSPRVEQLVALMQDVRRRGTLIVLHDGDYKQRCRYPVDLSSWCALALVNHAFDRGAWKIPTLRWPYFAQLQDEIAAPDPEWMCDLFFAGRLDQGEVYSKRTQLVKQLQRRGIRLRMPRAGEGNTLRQTPVIAASADAVLGFGRPGVDGWVDTRVFQYPGAGGILLHDDVRGYLDPWDHFVPYDSGDAQSVSEALRRLAALPPRDRQRIRERAFSYVQEKHNSVARVRQVLDVLGLGDKRSAA